MSAPLVLPTQRCRARTKWGDRCRLHTSSVADVPLCHFHLQTGGKHTDGTSCHIISKSVIKQTPTTAKPPVDHVVVNPRLRVFVATYAPRALILFTRLQMSASRQATHEHEAVLWHTDTDLIERGQWHRRGVLTQFQLTADGMYIHFKLTADKGRTLLDAVSMVPYFSSVFTSSRSWGSMAATSGTVPDSVTQHPMIACTASSGQTFKLDTNYSDGSTESSVIYIDGLKVMRNSKLVFDASNDVFSEITAPYDSSDSIQLK